MAETDRAMTLHIPLEAIQSSYIAALGYDSGKRILAVEFLSGAIYHYTGVAPALATAFHEAISRESFFASHIRGKYPGEKMTGTCPKCGAQHGWIGETCEDCGTATYAREYERRQ